MYCSKARPICRRLDCHSVRRTAIRTCCTAGSNSASSNPIIANTTNNSTSVKPCRSQQQLELSREIVCSFRQKSPCTSRQKSLRYRKSHNPWTRVSLHKRSVALTALEGKPVCEWLLVSLSYCKKKLVVEPTRGSLYRVHCKRRPRRLRVIF